MLIISLLNIYKKIAKVGSKIVAKIGLRMVESRKIMVTKRPEVVKSGNIVVGSGRKTFLLP
jgi:hypothetical protein